MTILNDIKIASVQARKNKMKSNDILDTKTSDFLITLYSEIAMIGKTNGNKETTDDEAIKLLKKFLTNAETMLALAKDELTITAIQNEVNIINQYLPHQLTYDELKDAIENIIIEHKKTNIGFIMKELKTKYGNNFNGTDANQIIKSFINV